MIDSLKPGNRLEITRIKDANTGKAYVSQVEEIKSIKDAVIHVPISYGQLVKLSTKEKYSMLFFTDKGMARFDAELIEYFKDGELNLIRIKFLSSGEKIQRREFFRFSCLLPLKYALVTNTDGKQTSDYSEETLIDGIIKDIGGGGIRFVSNHELEEKDVIRNILMLNDDCLVVNGKILHKQYFPKSNYKYQYRLEFTDIEQEDREKIIHYIFNEQRKIMQNTR